MHLHKLLKNVDNLYYPDIVQAGNLPSALSKNLADLGSRLVARTIPSENFIPYAIVEDGSRFSQVYLASEQRLFLFDFWSDGIAFGNASSDNISDVAKAISIWIIQKPSIQTMQSLFGFFSPTENGKAYEAGVIVEHQWQSLIENWRRQEELNIGNSNYSPIPLIEAAMNRPELRQLYPFTSLIRVCFSRTTGYPFTQDCPFAEPQGNGIYRVYSARSREIIGEGTLAEAIDMLVIHLPKGCGPAVNGTADDFTNP